MDSLNGPYGTISQKTQALCYVFITSQHLILHFQDAGVWLLMLLYLAMVLIIFGLKRLWENVSKNGRRKDLLKFPLHKINAKASKNVQN